MSESKDRKPSLVLWVLWGALFFSLFVYMLVLYMVISNAESFHAPEPEMIATLRIAFGAVALGEVIAIFVLRKVTFFKKLAVGDIDTLEELRSKYLTTCITSWALTEAIAIYGFVLAILTHQFVYYLVFLAPAVVLFVILRPQLRRLEDDFDVQRDDDKMQACVDPPPRETPSSGSW